MEYPWFSVAHLLITVVEEVTDSKPAPAGSMEWMDTTSVSWHLAVSVPSANVAIDIPLFSRVMEETLNDLAKSSSEPAGGFRRNHLKCRW